MANPVGEDNWLAYVEEETRRSADLEGRVKVVELFKKAIGAEPASLKIWLAYCEYFWSLFVDSQSAEAGWSDEEQQLGRELFSFDSALSLWSEGYEAIKFRLNDSHEFWNRWVSIEQEQLARTRTPVGVRRISHLFRDRLQVPHATWDNTSQMFSSFLSNYNNVAYETEFKEVTAAAQPAKEAYDERERRELELNKFARARDDQGYKAVMRDYLEWEMAQTTKPHLKNPALTVTLALALYSRALTDVFAFDDETWSNYVVFLSTLRDSSRVSQFQYVLPDTLNVLQRATSHCPWSGSLWSRYILSAEEAGWAFHDVEHIKHAATNSKGLDKNGMTGVIDMYAAWCGYLKRNALRANATDDAVDIADVGLVSALEDVKMWGERMYKDEYRGDPNYRLERIVIQYLTEKGEIEEARKFWTSLADQPLLKGSYDFWLNYYLWEMLVYSSQPRQRSPTPATPANGTKPTRVPSIATNILLRALQQDTLDWPERVMQVCQQHCNDHEQPETLRRALDTIHKARKRIDKRRARERAEAEAAYAAQAQATHHPEAAAAAVTARDGTSQEPSPSNAKRKRADTLEESTYDANKRPRNDEVNGADATANEQSLKRDRENTSVMVRNLPPDVTLTAARKYFKDYGHIINATIKKEEDGSSASALVEFESHEEMQSALLRDQKYFSEFQISVQPGTGLTIYVTNYPPTADEDYIRNLFKDCGDVFSIRFPSLKYNTHRRFCYVSFKDPEGAAKATKLEGKLLEGRYKLEAKYSDPSSKKKRQGAVAEGRELRIKNIDAKTTEDDLRAVFGKYGQVESVKVLKDLKGKNRGTAFAVMETKEQAESALGLDKTKLGSNIVEVELSKETNFKPTASSKADPASANADVTMADDGTAAAANKDKPSQGEIRARSMAIMNLPDTVNDARVRAMAEKYGGIVKVVLRPDHQGAIIEYADVTAVGRSMMALNGLEVIPGTKLRTGTVGELFKEKAAEEKGKEKGKSAPKLMAPTQIVRRPAVGSQRPKQRAGFTAAAGASGAGGKKTEDVNGTGPGVKPKSNADFKAMFLGSKE